MTSHEASDIKEDVSADVSTNVEPFEASNFGPIRRKRTIVKCEICLKAMLQKSLNRHMKKMHELSVSTSKNSIECKICSKVMLQTSLKRHTNKMYPDLKTIDSDGVLEYHTFNKWITGYHVYQDIWTPEIGEILTCEIDPANPYDRYAVSVTSEGEIVGHIPRTVSKTITTFLLADGKVEANVISKPQRTRRNGIIVPCTYVLRGSQSIIERVKDDIYNNL